MMTYLVPGVGADEGEFELVIVRVHAVYLLSRGRAENFDDFHQLINTALAGEQRLSKHQLRKHAPD